MQAGHRRASDAATIGLIWTLVLVALADFLFFRHPIGWTPALFAGAAMLMLLADRRTRSRPAWFAAAAAAVIGLLVAIVEYPGLQAVAMAAGGLAVLAMARRPGAPRTLGKWAERTAAFFLMGWAQGLRDSALYLRWRRSRAYAMSVRFRGLLQWLGAALLGLVFAGLFALANPIIEGWTDELATFVSRLGENVSIMRLMLWVFTGLWVWALWRGRTGPRRIGSIRPALLETTTQNEHASGPSIGDALARLTIWRGASFVARCLIVFNALFLMQTALDVVYLFGGAKLPDGMTYAQYAHRGAYPLVATALLAAGFVLIAFRPGGAAQRDAWCRRLVSLWLAQNVFLTFNAVWRLGLYVNEFSLTRWRVAAGIWMALIAMGLALVLWRIARDHSNRWLIHANALAAGAVLYACCFMNFDGMIADYNVRHCREVTGRGAWLDVAYLEHLGPESLDALAWIETFSRERQATPAPGPAVGESIPLARRRLQGELEADLSDWRGWNWRWGRLAARHAQPEYLTAGR